MKRKYLIIVVIILIAILIIPIPSKLKDGGSIEFKSLTYKITKVHRLNNNSKSGYDDGGSVEYHYDDYTIIKFHTLEGNRDVYIGDKKLELSDVK